MHCPDGVERQVKRLFGTGDGRLLAGAPPRKPRHHAQEAKRQRLQGKAPDSQALYRHRDSASKVGRPVSWLLSVAYRWRTVNKQSCRRATGTNGTVGWTVATPQPPLPARSQESQMAAFRAPASHNNYESLKTAGRPRSGTPSLLPYAPARALYASRHPWR